MNEEPKTWITGRSAMILLKEYQIGLATLRKYADSGKIRVATTPGGHRRYHRDDVLNLMEGK